MRILLSGMTKMQAHRPRRREYNTSINALYQALVAAKHKVDWRAIEYNENRALKQYDLCIIGLGTISEFSCSYLYETLLATQAENVLYLVNDWKANSTIKVLTDGDIFRDFVLKNNTGSRLPIARVKQDMKLLEKCRQQMFRHEPKLIGPFFEGWGNREIITDGTPFESVYEFDPSVFYLKQWKGIFKEVKKKRQWVYGALSDYAKWHEKLNATWPIHAFNKKTFIPEPELVELYNRSYGILFPKYKASGSGWWRARYCHALICKNVIYGDCSEFEGLPGEFWCDVQTIEKTDRKQLERFVSYQHETLRERMPTWDHVVDNVDNIVHEATK